MPRPLIALLLLAATARAAGLPAHLGMYPQSGAPLAMLDTRIAVTVRGPIVEAIVTQRFRNDSDRATEATYIFPLPVDAAVSAMSITTGARTIHAAIEPRASAQRRYEAAIAAGIGAGLLDQERPDVFTQTVSAIPPHGVVEVTLRIDAAASYHDGVWQLVLPLVVAPRYVPGTASGRPTTGGGRAPDTDRAPDASRVTPAGAPDAGGAVDVAIEFADPVDDVASPTHALAGSQRRYTFVDPHGDHDAIVRWRAKTPALGWVEQDDDGGYAAVVVTGPAPASARTTALRCLLVIDRAATTRGDADAAMRPVVHALLGALTAKDSVAAIGSDRVDWRAPEQARRALDDAWAKPAGAFDLTATLAAAHADGAAIVLLSDGLVADDARALAAAKQLRAPIHVIGVGPAPNRALLAALATQTGGTIRYATLGDDFPALARAVIGDAGSPPPPLAVSWGALAASDVVPQTLPRVGAGQAVLVIARVKRARAANARARGDVFALEPMTSPPPPDGATSRRGALARRWARLRLDELLADRKAATAHALRYGLVSPYTSMVAIGDEVVVEGGVKHTVAVPVSVPAGMRWQDVKREVTVDTTVTVDGRLGNERDEQKPALDGDAHAHRPTDAPKPDRPAKTAPSRDAPTAKKGHDARVDNTKQPRQSTAGKDRGPVARAPATQPPPAPPPPLAPQAGEATGSAGATGSVTRGADADDADTNVAKAANQPEARRFDLDVSSPIAITGAAQRAPGLRRGYRITTGLALGYTARHDANRGATLGVDGRFEVGDRTLGGLDGALWLVDGLHLDGTLLATLARQGVVVRWLELGAGLGFRFGNGVGPAIGVSLRVAPWRWHGRAAVFGRYDGALRFHDATRDGDNAATAGVEWRW